MKLSSLLDPHLVVVGGRYDSLESAIRTAIAKAGEKYPDCMYRGRCEDDGRQESVYDLVLRREAQASTVMPSGIAVPHARIRGFGNFLITAVLPEAPIPTPEGVPVRLVWLIVSEPESAGTYLNVLASLVRLSTDETLFPRLLRAADGRAFVDILEKARVSFSKVLKVEDIMSRGVVSIRDDASLRDLVDLMYEKNLRYLPVIDAAGCLVGELGILDVIEAGIPDYAFRLENLGFLSELEPMANLLKNESVLKVASIMNPSPQPVDPDSSLVDVAFKMARSRKRHYPVVQDGKLVGVISSMDILTKVLRA